MRPTSEETSARSGCSSRCRAAELIGRNVSIRSDARLWASRRSTNARSASSSAESGRMSTTCTMIAISPPAGAVRLWVSSASSAATKSPYERGTPVSRPNVTGSGVWHDTVTCRSPASAHSARKPGRARASPFVRTPIALPRARTSRQSWRNPGCSSDSLAVPFTTATAPVNRAASATAASSGRSAARAGSRSSRHIGHASLHREVRLRHAPTTGASGKPSRR